MYAIKNKSQSENQAKRQAKLYALLCAILFTAFVTPSLTSCKGHPEHADSGKEAGAQIWTCPMHPSIRSPKPDSCPICGMDLVPAGPAATSPKNKTITNPSTPPTSSTQEKSLTPLAEGSQIYIDPEKQKSLGLTYAEASVRSLHRQARAPLRLEPDPSGLTEISIKAGSGIVVGVDIGFPGQDVKKGQRLFTVLSEGWIQDQLEYIRSVQSLVRKPFDEKNANLNTLQNVLNRTRARLRLWDLNEDQIQDLEQIAANASGWDTDLRRRLSNNLEIRSPLDGYVVEKNVVKGMRYESGQKLLQLAPRTPLWGMAAFTPEDASRIKLGDLVGFSIDTLPGVEFSAPVDHVDPITDPQTRRIAVHLKIADPLTQLRPGQTGAASLNLPSVSVLSVPASALLPLGRDHVVFVDHGNGHIEPRRVIIGERFEDYVAVRSGLKEGEKVTTSANFLLDSEARLKGVLPVTPPAETP
jgi:Cu(I)/Ag(I) efflux system membrane fusion protein